MSNWTYIYYMKTIEEIRRDNGINQSDFAKEIGIAFRTYQKRITNRTEWLISELIYASQFNGGEILVELPQGKYELTVRKVSE